MPKGMFSQGVCLLTDGQTTIDGLRSVVESAGFTIAKQRPASDKWQLGGASLIVPYRPQINGSVILDVVERPWPDAMGDPKADPNTFAAWGMGFFGPFTFPQSLARASEHVWDWREARSALATSKGCIRLLLTYAGGKSMDEPLLPSNVDHADEMKFLSRLAIAASSTRGVVCHFNPGGEKLVELEKFKSIYGECARQKKLPLLLWSNVRLFNLSEKLLFMDTVGNEQLGTLDVEVIFPKEQYDPSDVDYYLRNVTHYLLESGKELRAGQAIDGPGETNLSWMIECPREPQTLPPRRVVRVFPKAIAAAVRAAIPSDKERGKQSWFASLFGRK